MENIRSILQKSPHFQEGRQEFQQGKVDPNNSIEPIWVKKRVSNKEWNNFYSQNSSYCFLRKEENMVIVGFLIVGLVSENCDLCDEEELRQIDDYRRSHNIHPKPLKDMHL